MSRQPHHRLKDLLPKDTLMADYYVSTSLAFIVTDTEAETIKALFDWVDEGIENNAPPPLPLVVKAALGLPDDTPDSDIIAKIFSDPDNPYFADHDILTVLGTDKQTVEVWGEQIEPDSIANLIFLFAKSALPFGFEWSQSCSKMRPDSFGGGYAAIFPDRIEIHSTHDLLRSALQKEASGPASPNIIRVTVEGHPTVVVASLKDASDHYSAIRQESGEGASTFPNGQVFLGDSWIGSISYNGRIWAPSVDEHAKIMLYDNRPPS